MQTREPGRLRDRDPDVITRKDPEPVSSNLEGVPVPEGGFERPLERVDIAVDVESVEREMRNRIRDTVRAELLCDFVPDGFDIAVIGFR